MGNDLVELTVRAADLAKRLDSVTRVLDTERNKYEERISGRQAEHDQLSAELATVVSQIGAATGGPAAGGAAAYDKTAVLEALRLEPESSAGGIRNTLKADPSKTDAINKALAALHREGKVRTVEGARGRYKRYVAV